jgi:hypothetical protein
MVEGELRKQEQLTLPDFLWLLRDVDTVPVGVDITEDVKQMLKKNKACKELGSIVEFFPSFHCLTIPPPSADDDILAEITSNLDNLSIHFNKGIDDAIKHMLDEIRIKVGCGSSTKCDGSMLACLIEQFFVSISEPTSKFPTFQSSWIMAIELKLKKVAKVIVKEYDDDMSVQLGCRMPLPDGQDGETGETLMNVHQQIFAKKRLKFLDAILSCQTQRWSTKLRGFENELISDFDRQIAEFDPTQNRVIGGRLFKFIQDNFKASEKACSSLYKKKYEKIVRVKLLNALGMKVYTSIRKEVNAFWKEYYNEAIGPAVNGVYNKMRADSLNLEEELRLIPGPVGNLRLVGIDSDRVKLKWSCPEINSYAVSKYTVKIRSWGKDWDHVSTQTKCSVLITDLESSTWYCVSVVAAGEAYTSEDVSLKKFQTKLCSSAQKALVTVASVVASPIVLPTAVASFGVFFLKESVRNESLGEFLLGAAAFAHVPPAVLVGAIPGVGTWFTYETLSSLNKARKGDLEEEDARVVSWSGSAATASDPARCDSLDTEFDYSAFKVDLEALQDFTDSDCVVVKYSHDTDTVACST